MNLDLKSEKINFLRPVFTRRLSREETMEIIVPDSLPDVLRIVDTDGTPYLRSKDADTGRVTATGIVEAVIMYLPESGNGVRKLEVNIPFTVTADGGEITPDCLINAKISMISSETRMINSRKLMVRVELSCGIDCFSQCSLFAGHPNDIKDIYMRAEQQKVMLASSVSEKTFILTDELRIKSAAQPIGEVLKAKTMLKCDEIKPVGNKAVIKGMAISEIVYSAKDTSDICVENFTTPFSQIVETDQANEAATITAQMMLTGVYITRNLLDDGSGEAMTLEIHAVAQCTSYTEFDIEYVADVYSPKYELSLGQGEYNLDSFGDMSAFSDTVKGLIPAEKPDVVRAVSIYPGHIVCTPKDNVTSAVMDFSVSIIYTDMSGALCCASKKLEYVHDFEMKLDSSDIEIVCGDEFTSAVENGIELRIPIEVNVRRHDSVSVSCVEMIEYDETAPKDTASLPSMTIIRVGDKCDLWSIAKRYDSSVAVITEVNELNDDKPIKADEILMIPRLR